MAKKKTKPVKKSATPRTPPIVRSPKFVRNFLAEFVGGPKPQAWKWPIFGQSGLSILEDFQTFTQVLMTAGYLEKPVVPDGSGSLQDRVSSYVIAQSWPPPASKNVKTHLKQLSARLAEISLIADSLFASMEANPPADMEGSRGTVPPH